ncbi:MAG: glycerol-3-phosphate dehydrogenase [Flavobacteriia bacterium]|nr:MAG: glycerol-3-phosphate dehydrogenase [Flavobacteriia bacterium]
MSEQPKVSVIGGGSWATAIVKMLSENLSQIGWYIRSPFIIEHLKRHGNNPDYISQVNFDREQLQLFDDINKAVAYDDILIFAIPSAFLDSELKNLNTSLQSKKIISAIKGIVPETGLIVGEHFHNHYQVSYQDIGVITGPCHAEEVAMERLSYLTIGSQNKTLAKTVSKLLQSSYIKTTTTDDIIGTEYAAMLKNIYALAAGIAHGLGYGDNFQAVLMSNAIREMKRFTKKVWKTKRNINNSAYLGDLLVTGYSLFSRNRTFGNMIGKGYTVKSAMMELKMVAEGYYATKSAFELNKTNQARTPILDTVYHILYEHADPKKAFKDLTMLLD